MLQSAAHISKSRVKQLIRRDVPAFQLRVNFSTEPTPLTHLQKIIQQAELAAKEGADMAESLSKNRQPENNSVASNLPTGPFARPKQPDLKIIKNSNSNKMKAMKRLDFSSLDAASVASDEAAYNRMMKQRQLKSEEEQLREASEAHQETFNHLAKMSRGTTLKAAQKLMLQWYDPLVAALKADMDATARGELTDQNQFYGAYLMQVPVEKLAVITLTTTLNSMLRSGNVGERLNRIFKEISDIVEAESHVLNLKKNKDLPFWNKKLLKKANSRVTNNRQLGTFNAQLRKIAQGEPWSDVMKMRIGAKLVDVLLKTAQHNNGQPAFIHSNTFSLVNERDPYRLKMLGTVRMDPTLFQQFANLPLKDSTLLVQRFLPMLVPPKPWDNTESTGAYFTMKAPLLKAISAAQTTALRNARMSSVLESLDYLGQMGWRINPVVHNVIKSAWEQKIAIAELPCGDPMPPPDPSTCYRTVREANATWDRFMEKRAAAEELRKKEAEEKGEVYEPPAFKVRATVAMNPDEVRLDEKLLKHLTAGVTKRNAEMHSLQCDVKIKLNIAEKFKDDAMYFPHNVDFRGRAYPIPPNLSHLGNDFCRGIMMFDKAKKLGPEGLRWLKIHLCNLFGNNKISQNDRVAWTDANMEKIRASVAAPLEGERWWSTAEEPFQALAAMAEIVAATDSPNHEEYECRLPVHQDGSCNGLQHYAGLGRDAQGGAAVNLVPHDVPADVYSGVLTKVLAKIEVDAELPADDARAQDGVCARMVRGYVTRKVIKQTVMTSVYGVTQSGARAQVDARLREVFKFDSTTATPEYEKEISVAAAYLANLTLVSLSEMFSSARSIMDWLGTCAKLVAQQNVPMSWMTPLGLPVIQPYRKIHMHSVTTVMQSITLTVKSDLLPISATKQRSAFPPNFVHSMDATHMMMTSLKMKKLGLNFAAVHDSYWTHPCDIPVMNKCLREAFVELYSMPLLEDLLDSLQIRFPHIEFPPLPERGTLDIESVKESQFFFH